MAKDDVYYHAATYYHPNAVVNVFRPILTEEERAKRMRAINDAAYELLTKGRKKKEAVANEATGE